jgi:hypothetical protein
LDVDVLGVAEALRLEIVEEVFLSLRAGHIGKLDFLRLTCLRVAILQLLENIEERIIRQF